MRVISIRTISIRTISIASQMAVVFLSVIRRSWLGRPSVSSNVAQGFRADFCVVVVWRKTSLRKVAPFTLSSRLFSKPAKNKGQPFFLCSRSRNFSCHRERVAAQPKQREAPQNANHCRHSDRALERTRTFFTSTDQLDDSNDGILILNCTRQFANRAHNRLLFKRSPTELKFIRTMRQ